MKNAERRLELTSKFVQMGKALVEEGRQSEDLIISQLGSMIIFLGGICFDDNDVTKFGDLVSMYSAKKLLESLEEDNDPRITAMRRKAESDTYESILNNIDGLIDDAKKGKLDDEDEINFDQDGDDDND